MDALGIEDDESARRREEAEHKQRSAKEAEVMRLRYDTARQEWNERKNEMQECINSVDGCIEMLFPPEEEWTAPGAETAPETGLSTSEGVVIDSAAEGAQSASDTEGSTVEWEEDDTEQVEPASDALQPADTTVDGSTGRPPDQEDDWEDEYLRTGGGTEVSGSGDASFAVGDEAEDGEGGEWDVDRLVADAGLGSRAYELDIDFDANLGQLETEGQLSSGVSTRAKPALHRHSQFTHVLCVAMSAAAAGQTIGRSFKRCETAASSCKRHTCHWYAHSTKTSADRITTSTYAHPLMAAPFTALWFCVS